MICFALYSIDALSISLISLDFDYEYMVLAGRRDSVWWKGDVEADGGRLIIELVLKVLWQ